MVAPNGIYKLAVIGTHGGQQHVHTLHFRSTTAASATGASETQYMTDLVTAWQGAPEDAYRALFPTSDQCVQYFQVRKVCGSLPLPAGLDINQTGGSTAGTNTPAGDVLAPWLAQVTTLRTNFSGRSYRGRNFIGGLHEGYIVGATLSGPRTTLTTTYYTALKTAFIDPTEIAVGFKLFVFSRKLATTAGVQCQEAGGDVVSFLVRDQLATMKSRKAGSGI